jgi:hypothetical protein
MLLDLRQALGEARDRLGERVLPVLAPPWNRIAPDLVPALPGIGYRGLSTFRTRPALPPAIPLVQVDSHLDPIDWRGSRSAVDAGAFIGRAADLINARIEGRSDPDEPIGLLTHHRIHDEGVWALCEAFLERVGSSAAARRPFVDELFSCQGAAGP